MSSVGLPGVRVLPAELTPDRPAFIARVRGLSTLSHPNVTTLFEAGEHEGRVFLAFEFLKGQSLRAEMAGRPLKVHRAVETAIQIADAIADAHANGFVHGGLSPESVAMTQKGHAKIPAFELAAHGGFDSGSPGQARLLDYLSPEEAGGQPADDRSDIYSVGAILYEMLTAKRPNPKGAAAPSAGNRHVPPELDALVLRAVAPNPASRPQSAAGFASELRGITALIDSQGGASDERDESHGPSTSSGRVLLFAVVLLAIGGFAWWLLMSR